MKNTIRIDTDQNPHRRELDGPGTKHSSHAWTERPVCPTCGQQAKDTDHACPYCGHLL